MAEELRAQVAALVQEGHGGNKIKAMLSRGTTTA